MPRWHWSQQICNYQGWRDLPCTTLPRWNLYVPLLKFRSFASKHLPTQFIRPQYRRWSYHLYFHSTRDLRKLQHVHHRSQDIHRLLRNRGQCRIDRRWNKLCRKPECRASSFERWLQLNDRDNSLAQRRYWCSTLPRCDLSPRRRDWASRKRRRRQLNCL